MVVEDFRNFVEQYKNFTPSNIEDLKQKVITILNKTGYIVDSYFEGDYATGSGVYARSKDKTTYLNPKDVEEVALQEKYSVNGFKQYFSEWFEWETKDNELV